MPKIDGTGTDQPKTVSAEKSVEGDVNRSAPGGQKGGGPVKKIGPNSYSPGKRKKY